MAGSKAVLVGLHEKSASIVLPLLLDDGAAPIRFQNPGRDLNIRGGCVLRGIADWDHLFFISKQWLVRVMHSYFYI